MAYVYTRGQRKGEIELRESPEIKVFTIQCASPVGENANGRSRGRRASNSYWRTKTAGDEYTIDCVNKIILAKNSNRLIKFQ